MTRYVIHFIFNSFLDSSSLNIDSGLDTSLPSNNTKTTGGRQEFLLITVSCSNIKYSAILKKNKLHKEALILRLVIFL